MMSNLSCSNEKQALLPLLQKDSLRLFISCLQALNYLPNLEEVNASGNRLKSVSDLSKCKHLQELDLSGNRLTDLSGLRGLPKLQVRMGSSFNDYFHRVIYNNQYAFSLLTLTFGY